jgi:tagatose 1,6-diphosphate aldolase GatY/KbaY
MKFIPAASLIRAALEGGYAVPSFTVWNAEAIDTVLRVATACRAPVLLMAGPGEFSLTPPPLLADLARSVAARYDVPAALHLDHGDSPECVETCIAAGFTSVMLDYSSRPLAENTGALRQVALQARPRGITVEGELGAVGFVRDVGGGEGAKVSSLTDPAEAAAFVAATGVDMLAVSFGNVHGLYTRRPQFDFDRLAAIRRAAGVPLVLHGGSGTPDEDLRRAISLGIAKVNVASELMRALRDAVRDPANEHLWLPKTLALGMAAVGKVVEKWFTVCGAVGKAAAR